MRCYDCEKIADMLFPVHVCEKHCEFDKYVCRECFKNTLKGDKE